MSEFFPVYVYFALVLLVTLGVMAASLLVPSVRDNKVKFLPYESGNITETHLLGERFPLKHYLVALMFLIFDVEVIFLFPWAVIGKHLGMFGFWEMIFFLVALLVGLVYVWRKGGLQWD